MNVRIANMRNKQILTPAIIAILSVGIYLMVSWWIYDFGFPVDDAWIHQTYARNFAQSGRWEFQSGQVSGGSTGPLWGILLAGFHLISPGAIWGAYILGVILLWGVALVSGHAYRELLPQNRDITIVVSLLVIFEWHLVWAAASGMETLAFSLVAIFILGNLLTPHPNWTTLGIAAGVSIWLRPGGITLLAPILFVMVVHRGPIGMGRRILETLFGFGVLVIPYLVFNRAVAGDFLPNTFYAKQAEYAALREIPLLERVGRVGIQPFIGVGIVLLPGLLSMVVELIRKREWEALAGPLWAAGYVGMYAWRLPVTYQHGRYLIPVIPILLVWGLAGLVDGVDISSSDTKNRVLSRTWVGVVVSTVVVFWGMGARVYGRDVAVIETEMVRVAQWVERNTEEGAVLAAHDIGALGYFTDREVVDLAGLVSPDVIPFIRNEAKLRGYLNQKDVDYLIVFPGWYEDLEQGLEKVFQTQGPYAIQFDQKNMAIYRWRSTSAVINLEDHHTVCLPTLPVLYSQGTKIHLWR